MGYIVYRGTLLFFLLSVIVVANVINDYHEDALRSTDKYDRRIRRSAAVDSADKSGGSLDVLNDSNVLASRDFDDHISDRHKNILLDYDMDDTELGTTESCEVCSGVLFMIKVWIKFGKDTEQDRIDRQKDLIKADIPHGNESKYKYDYVPRDNTNVSFIPYFLNRCLNVSNTKDNKAVIAICVTIIKNSFNVYREMLIDSINELFICEDQGYCVESAPTTRPLYDDDYYGGDYIQEKNLDDDIFIYAKNNSETRRKRCRIINGSCADLKYGPIETISRIIRQAISISHKLYSRAAPAPARAAVPLTTCEAIQEELIQDLLGNLMESKKALFAEWLCTRQLELAGSDGFTCGMIIAKYYTRLLRSTFEGIDHSVMCKGIHDMHSVFDDPNNALSIKRCSFNTNILISILFITYTMIYSR